jgi:hypothetical protein
VPVQVRRLFPPRSSVLTDTTSVIKVRKQVTSRAGATRSINERAFLSVRRHGTPVRHVPGLVRSSYKVNSRRENRSRKSRHRVASRGHRQRDLPANPEPPPDQPGTARQRWPCAGFPQSSSVRFVANANPAFVEVTGVLSTPRTRFVAKLQPSHLPVNQSLTLSVAKNGK